MKKPLDRITDAYFGELGEEFSEKVRNRIHWICENAKGETILDVGCSQGIISILLGREGKKVIGVDLLQEAIDYANQMLSNEENVTKSLVEFRSANFMHLDVGDQTFDSIIFGEVLEHITDPERFINKAYSLLNDNGSIIITLPFGINDYFDHKKTYYLIDLLKLATENLVVQEIKFFGKWVGAVLKKKGKETSTVSINEELISRLEGAFYSVEKDLWQQIRNNEQKIKTLEEKLKLVSADIEKIKSAASEQVKEKNTELNTLKNLIIEKDNKINSLNIQVEESNKELQMVKESFQAQLDLKEKEKEETIESLRTKLDLMEQEKEEIVNTIYSQINDKAQELQNSQKDEKIKELTNQLKQKEQIIAKLQQKDKEKTNQITELEKQVIIAKKEKIQVQETLYESYTKEERLLKSYQTLLRKYRALSESKLGKLTLTYWKKRRKVMGGK